MAADEKARSMQRLEASHYPGRRISMSEGTEFLASLKKAREYGLEAFLELTGELSRESSKQGRLDRKT